MPENIPSMSENGVFYRESFANLRKFQPSPGDSALVFRADIAPIFRCLGPAIPVHKLHRRIINLSAEGGNKHGFVFKSAPSDFNL